MKTKKNVEEESNPPFDERERERNQRLNITEGSFSAVTAGLTNSFLVPFALVLGASNTLVALLTTLPSLIGAFVQLGVQKIRPIFSSRRQYMFFFSLLQALLWLPLVFIPQMPHPGVWLIILITLNTAAGFLIIPVWNSFTADIVSENHRGTFFGKRNTWTGVSAFFSTLFAGLLLDILRPKNPFLAFIILFILAFLFKMMGAILFTRMGAPPEAQTTSEFPEPQELLIHANQTPFGRFTLFLMFFHIAVNIASPFFTVYQLSILGFTYMQFTVLACASAIASFVTMFLWGKHVDKIGARAVLVSCGLLIPLIPLVWATTTTFKILILTEMFSGIVWAGFNLSASTYIFDATDRAKRTRQVSEYTLLVQLAMFAGAILGSQIIDHYGKSLANSYIHVFFLSAALRFVAVLIFYKAIKEQRIIDIPIRGRLFRQFVSIKPQQGIVYQTAVESTGTIHDSSKTPREFKEEIESLAGRIQKTKPSKRKK